MRAFVVVMMFALAMPVSAKPSAKFVKDQARAARVKKARAKWTGHLKARLKDLGLKYPARAVMMRAFKQDGELEIFASDKPYGPFVLVETIPICAKSGGLGPKRQQGDLQVPEGFYVVDRFNAWSSYHLSLGINYPNRSDRIRGKRPLGGDIFVHGECVTIGCIPIENDPIERVYVLALDSFIAHHNAVHVHIFPTRLDDDGRARLRATEVSAERVAFWANLSLGYQAFEENKMLPRVSVDGAGAYKFKRRSR